MKNTTRIISSTLVAIVFVSSLMAYNAISSPKYISTIVIQPATLSDVDIEQPHIIATKINSIFFKRKILTALNIPDTDENVRILSGQLKFNTLGSALEIQSSASDLRTSRSIATIVADTYIADFINNNKIQRIINKAVCNGGADDAAKEECSPFIKDTKSKVLGNYRPPYVLVPVDGYSTPKMPLENNTILIVSILAGLCTYVWLSYFKYNEKN